MRIKQDPVTKLWAREDGAVLLPPCRNIHRFTYTWTYGTMNDQGYCQIRFRGKIYKVHQIVCRAFNGLPPEDKPFVDHIDRCKSNNKPSNLRWTSCKENLANQAKVDRSIEKYGVRECDDKATYDKAYHELHRDEFAARNRAYGARKRAKMRAQGLSFRKGPDGKHGWFPRIRS